MQTAQISSPRFSYQATVPAPRKLDDFRVVHEDYAGSFSAKSRSPLLLAAIVIAAIAGVGVGAYKYSGRDAEKLHTAALSHTVSVPIPTETAPAPSNRLAEPLNPPGKSQEINPASPVGQATSENTNAKNPANARNALPARSASAPTRSTMTVPPVRSQVVVPTPQEVPPMPIPTPARPIIEEPPVMPSPEPIVPPAEPPKV